MTMPTQPQRAETPTRTASPDYVTRFFGGPPLAVIFRLVLLSILVGIILDLMGLDPLNIIDSLQRLVRQVWDMGFDAARWAGRYLLLGAALVVPVWLIVRLTQLPRGR